MKAFFFFLVDTNKKIPKISKEKQGTKIEKKKKKTLKKNSRLLVPCLKLS